MTFLDINRHKSNLYEFTTLDWLDKIFLSELWIYFNEMKEFNLTGYDFHAVTNDGYAPAGRGTFVQPGLNASQIPSVSCDVLKLSLSINNYTVHLLVIYRLQMYSIGFF